MPLINTINKMVVFIIVHRFNHSLVLFLFLKALKMKTDVRDEVPQTGAFGNLDALIAALSSAAQEEVDKNKVLPKIHSQRGSNVLSKTKIGRAHV